jgi:type IV pilus assembly protein PilB
VQDIGVESYLIASSTQCIIAQRLVRVICSACRTSAQAGPELAREFGQDVVGVDIFRGTGCKACHVTGFLGRTVIYEILPVTNSIRDLIVSRAPANVIRAKAIEEGMRTLRQCGWGKILQGVTTPDEVLRATLQETI